MILSMESQALLFATTVAVGMVIGFIYDIFRVIRLTFKHPDFLIHVEDSLYWLVVSFVMFYVMLFKNYGEIRLFSIVGAFLGMIIYFFTISRLFMRVSEAVVNIAKKITAALVTIILFPFKLLIKILSWPARLIRKVLLKILASIKKVLQKTKRYAKMKGRKTAHDFRIILKKH